MVAHSLIMRKRRVRVLVRRFSNPRSFVAIGLHFGPLEIEDYPILKLRTNL